MTPHRDVTELAVTDKLSLDVGWLWLTKCAGWVILHSYQEVSQQEEDNMLQKNFISVKLVDGYWLLINAIINEWFLL